MYKRKKRKEDEFDRRPMPVALRSMPVARRSMPVARRAPMEVNYRVNQREMDSMRRAIAQRNMPRGARIEIARRQIEQRNMIVQQEQQRQMAGRSTQITEHNMRVSGGEKRP
tara:strand:- start:591 stop:926 length:336 start_codon:yes stop_codon:yes gene_type:complete